MPKPNTYRLFEILKTDTSVIQVPAEQPGFTLQLMDQAETRIVEVPAESSRFIIQLLDKDSRTAADRARAEKARQEVEELVADFGEINDRLIFLESFYTNDNTTADFSSLVFVSGSFQGDAHFSFLEIEDTVKYKKDDNFLITSQSNDTSLLIGNSFNNFENKQTTTFKNAEVIVSGSMEVTQVLKLTPLEQEPDPVEGGLYYSTEGSFFAGVG